MAQRFLRLGRLSLQAFRTTHTRFMSRKTKRTETTDLDDLAELRRRAQPLENSHLQDFPDESALHTFSSAEMSQIASGGSGQLTKEEIRRIIVGDDSTSIDFMPNEESSGLQEHEIDQIFQLDSRLDSRPDSRLDSRGETIHKKQDEEEEIVVDDEVVQSSQTVKPKYVHKPLQKFNQDDKIEEVSFGLGKMQQREDEGKSNGVRQLRVAAAMETAIKRAIYIDVIDKKLAQFNVEIESVTLGTGMRHACVRWHSINKEQDALIEEAFQKQKGRLRQAVTRTLNMKYSPVLTFRRSDARLKAEEIEHLFAKIATEN